MKINRDTILVTSSEPIALKTNSDDDTSTQGPKLRRVVDMSSINAQKKTTVSYPPAQNAKSKKQAQPKDHKPSKHADSKKNRMSGSHHNVKHSSSAHPKASRQSSDTLPNKARVSSDTPPKIVQNAPDAQHKLSPPSSDTQPKITPTPSDTRPPVSHTPSDPQPRTTSQSSAAFPRIALPDTPISVPAVAYEPEMFEFAQSTPEREPFSNKSSHHLKAHRTSKHGPYKTSAKFAHNASPKFQQQNRNHKKYAQPLDDFPVPENVNNVSTSNEKNTRPVFAKPLVHRSSDANRSIKKSSVRLSRTNNIKIKSKQPKLTLSRFKLTNSSETARHIVAQLLLQSWQARMWVECLVNIGQNFIENMLSCMPLVQAKLVSNLDIQNGELTAEVIRSKVSFKLHQFTPGQWRTVINMLSERALFSTALLNGELPEGIVDVFKQGSVSLFPQKIRELIASCDICENAQCEHVCAVLLTIAQRLDEDPFFLLQLRGITREDLLNQLRNARSAQVVDAHSKYGTNYEFPAGNIDFTKFYTPKADLSEFDFHIALSESTLLKRLGNPNTWGAPINAEAAFAPIIRLTALVADEIGLNAPTNDENEFATSCDFETAVAHSSAMLPRVSRLPNIDFLENEIPPEIAAEMARDLQSAGDDLLNWLKTLGATDIRTLARRTRLKKTEVKLIVNAFLNHELIRQEGEGEKAKFIITMPYKS